MRATQDRQSGAHADTTRELARATGAARPLDDCDPIPFGTLCGSADLLHVDAGTQGGGSGQRSRTILRLQASPGADFRLGVNGARPESAQSVEIMLVGDAELEALVDALEFALAVLADGRHA
jgi:hypothetical protein